MKFTETDQQIIKNIFNDTKDCVDFDEDGFVVYGRQLMFCRHSLLRYDINESILYVPYNLKIIDNCLYPMDKSGKEKADYWDYYRKIKTKSMVKIKEGCYELLKLFRDAKMKYKLEHIDKDFD